jgi:hypothetical protein
MVKMTEWISVKDEVPPLDTPVLCINPFDEMHVCILENRWESEPITFWVTASYEFYPTHWMPLPKSPLRG